FPSGAPAIGALPIERHAPRHAHEPRPEALAIPQLIETAIGLGEGLLRNILSVLAVAQDAIGDTNRERRRLDKARLEFPRQLPGLRSLGGGALVHSQGAVPGMKCSPLGAVMHVASPC